MQRKNRSYNNIDYKPLRHSDTFTKEQVIYTDISRCVLIKAVYFIFYLVYFCFQFVTEPSKIPIKSLCFAFCLLTLGLALLLTTSLQLIGYIHEKVSTSVYDLALSFFSVYLRAKLLNYLPAYFYRYLRFNLLRLVYSGLIYVH